MKVHETKTVWLEGMKFNTEVPGGEITFDADEDFGGNGEGLRPKGTMLGALAGCTGMDVSSLLTKMRVSLDSFRIEVDGELTDEHPKIYKTVRVRYYFSGEDLDRTKIEKAVNLSVDRYCGVYEMFRAFSDIGFTIHYE